MPPGPPTGGALSGLLLQAARINKPPARGAKRGNIVSLLKNLGRIVSAQSSNVGRTKYRHPRVEAPRVASKNRSTQQRRPRRVGRAAPGRHLVLVRAGQVDRVEPRGATAAAAVGLALTEIHQHPA